MNIHNICTQINCAHLMLLYVYALGSSFPRDRCRGHFQMRTSISAVLSKHLHTKTWYSDCVERYHGIRAVDSDSWL